MCRSRWNSEFTQYSHGFPHQLYGRVIDSDVWCVYARRHIDIILVIRHIYGFIYINASLLEICSFPCWRFIPTHIAFRSRIIYNRNTISITISITITTASYFSSLLTSFSNPSLCCCHCVNATISRLYLIKAPSIIVHNIVVASP